MSKNIKVTELDESMIEQSLLSAQNSIQGILDVQLKSLERDVPLAEALIKNMSTKQLRKTLMCVVRYPFFMTETGLNKKEEAAMQLIRSIMTSIVLLEMNTYNNEIKLLDNAVKDLETAANQMVWSEDSKENNN